MNYWLEIIELEKIAAKAIDYCHKYSFTLLNYYLILGRKSALINFSHKDKIIYSVGGNISLDYVSHSLIRTCYNHDTQDIINKLSGSYNGSYSVNYDHNHKQINIKLECYAPIVLDAPASYDKIKNQILNTLGVTI